MTRQGQAVHDPDVTYIDRNGATQACTLTLEAFRRLRARADLHVVTRTPNTTGETAA